MTRRLALPVIFNLLAGFALLEGTLALMLATPSLLRAAPPPVTSLVRHLYLRERVNVQFSPECAQFDPQLTYILKPGRCQYSTREFSHELRINSLGLRNDEASLRAPAIIATGDSITMGWGVPQDATFAKLLERRAGLTVLNAAVPSYGTVREMRLLDRLDLSNLRYLVIQYHENDWLENDTFYRNNNRLPITDEARYLELVAHSQQEKRYYFGKHTIQSIRRVYAGLGVPRLARGRSRPPTKQEHAARFLNAILHATQADLSSVQIIVLAIDSSTQHDGAFLAALRQQLASGEYPASLRTLTALDLSSRLTHDSRYILDDHLTAHGHHAIADALHEVIGADLGQLATAPARRT